MLPLIYTNKTEGHLSDKTRNMTEEGNLFTKLGQSDFTTVTSKRK